MRCPVDMDGAGFLNVVEYQFLLLFLDHEI